MYVRGEAKKENKFEIKKLISIWQISVVSAKLEIAHIG
tara:strand:- start:1214 stop:1327 length:114 start_codon:yes stop_codon:yes gene_type:complete